MNNEANNWFNAGVQQHQSGNLAQALEYYERAVQLQPDYAAAWYNLGSVFVAQGQVEQALDAFQKVVAFQPSAGDAWFYLGSLWDGQGKFEESVAAYQRAVQLSPQDANTHNNLGVVLSRLGRHEEATVQFQHTLAPSPHFGDGYVNLAVALTAQARLDEAARCYEQALFLDPNNQTAHRNRGLLYLLQGDFINGWPEYERHCWTRGDWRPIVVPIWDGSDLNGRTILLQSGFGQGLGDIIQFLRYAPLVQQRGGRVLVECPPSLLALASTCAGIDQLIPDKEPYPPIDVQMVMLSLPPFFSARVETVPAQVPYLFPDKRLIENWREAFAGDSGFKIGISWQGNPVNEVGLGRSAPLAEFAPLAQVPGVSLYSLQAGFGSEQLQDINFPVIDLGDRSSPPENLAALILNLDLVISTDTMISHLTGALGAPLWMALGLSPDWRWMLERSDCPWYPTARLFRQKPLGNWPSVFKAMAADLPKLVAARRQQ